VRSHAPPEAIAVRLVIPDKREVVSSILTRPNVLSLSHITTYEPPPEGRFVVSKPKSADCATKYPRVCEIGVRMGATIVVRLCMGSVS
jgi:hypothetical protein